MILRKKKVQNPIFASLIEKLDEMTHFAKEQQGYLQRDFWRVMMDAPAINQFLTQLLNENLDDTFGYKLILDEILRGTRPEPPKKSLNDFGYNKYLSAPSKTIARRKSDLYPLSVEEIAHADEILAASPALDHTIDFMQKGLCRYFEALQKEIRQGRVIGSKRADEHLHLGSYMKTLSQVLGGLEAEASKTADFRNALSRVIASALPQEHSVKSGRDYRLGVKKLFDRSAFSSIPWQSPHEPAKPNPAVTHCPFGKIFGAIWNADIVEGQNGGFEYSGRLKSGGFFDAFQARLSRDEANAAIQPEPAHP